MLPPTSPRSYPVPSAPHQEEIEVKRSRFIARAHPCADRDAAMQHLQQARRDFPDASHHCWAYLVGDPEQPAALASDDDGEPAGTAARPILNVIQHRGLGNIMVIVIRYFGGTKLGAGGLVRAYGQATQAALVGLDTEHHEPRRSARLHCTFAQEQAVRHWARVEHAEILGAEYGDGVTLSLTFPASADTSLEDFAAAQRITLALCDDEGRQ
ncbi:YigZ family protein [Motiliproteus sp. SC1-56]|uniref:IMPACT family protein n=1 Tax=Motiliproteus sp. SC1-56 TaxID=2799565 RepID=UPI001A9042F0|nr:YigZ family protein [Motiliproteus sp. SC1-56]